MLIEHFVEERRNKMVVLKTLIVQIVLKQTKIMKEADSEIFN
jgi:hypothetical protein